MTANSVPPKDDLYFLTGRDRENYGFARVRDIAYDAVQELWRKRKVEGWTQVRLAANIDRDTGWLSRYLQGPGNWTFRTFGALVEGLEGVVEIRVRPAETLKLPAEHDAYSDYDLDRDQTLKAHMKYIDDIEEFANPLAFVDAANDNDGRPRVEYGR
jgi:hypothetical protein